MDQKPSVGRIVHYQSHGSPDGTHKSEPRAAVITAVYPDLSTAAPGTSFGPSSPSVDLCVLNPTGLYFDRAVAFSTEPRAGCWSWPPRI